MPLSPSEIVQARRSLHSQSPSSRQATREIPLIDQRMVDDYLDNPVLHPWEKPPSHILYVVSRCPESWADFLAVLRNAYGSCGWIVEKVDESPAIRFICSTKGEAPCP